MQYTEQIWPLDKKRTEISAKMFTLKYVEVLFKTLSRSAVTDHNNAALKSLDIILSETINPLDIDNTLDNENFKNQAITNKIRFIFMDVCSKCHSIHYDYFEISHLW